MMNDFLVVVDLAEGTVGFEPAGCAVSDSQGGLLLAADARLDNQRELAKSLELPSTLGVAELILAACSKWGEGCLERLLGDFAFVLWEPRRRRLLAASDPLGVRPLYWTRTGQQLFVASEMRLLLNHPEVSRHVDLVAVGDYLSRIMSEPERTFFQDVHRLPGGHILTATPKDLRITRYWDPRDLPSLDLSEDEAAHHFLALFSQAVRDRLESCEGPIGIAMSGGLDSTSVAAVAARESSNSLLACSFVFDQLSECDERSAIQAVTEALGLEAAFINAEKFWFLKDADEEASHLDTPWRTWEPAFRQMLQILQERGGHILLTGHGADDLLGGSRLVFADRLRRKDFRVIREIWSYSRSRRYGWRPLYRLLVEPLLGNNTASMLRSVFHARRRAGIPSWISPNFVSRTGLAERLAEADRGPRRKTARDDMYENLVSRPGYHAAVEWYQRSSAPRGVEIRHPFLDRRLFEFVLSIPPEQLFRLGERKPLLRSALAGLLPDKVRLRHRKVSLGSFADFSFRQEAERIRSLLVKPLVAELGILDGGELRHAFKRYSTNTPDTAQRSLWYAITLELWLRHHLFVLEGTPYGALSSVDRQAA